MSFAWVDIVVLMVVGLFVIRNTWIGFLRGISSLLGLVAGVIVAGKYHSFVVQILSPLIKGKILLFLSYILTFLIAYLGVFIIFELIRRLFRTLQLSWIDRWLGFFLGLMKGSLVVGIAFMLLVVFFPRSQVIFKNSFTYPYLVQVTRFLVEFCPEYWRARFNYNLRHYFQYEGHASGHTQRSR